jgi:glycosyltransferase involved in cell wall biosynthesis
VYKGLRVIVVMPAYNAEKTVTQTYQEIMAQEIVDLIILVDDASSDSTVAVAKKAG